MLEAVILALACHGTGTANPISTYGETASIVVRNSTPGEQVDFRLSDNSAKIRLPKSILPAGAHSSDGWWDVRGMINTDAYITGFVKLNLIATRDIRIDRFTGHIEISGHSSFSGECEKVDLSAPKF